MANTNEVEQLNLQVGMDGANAQETLKLILGSLSGIQNKLLAIGKKLVKEKENLRTQNYKK